jgi:HlyD family secretion protein
VDIKSKAGGRIDNLLVDVGDRVRTGQVIARIDPSDSALTYNQAEADTASARAKESQTSAQYRLQVAQSQLSVAQARSQLKASEAALAASRARLATARHENDVQPALNSAAIAAAQAALDSATQDRAQLIATQPQDLATAKSTYDQASANLVAAKLFYERKDSLARQGYVALQEVDDAKAAYSVAQAQVDAAKTRLDKLGDQQKAAMATSDAKIRQAEAQVRSANAQTVTERTKQDAVRDA